MNLPPISIYWLGEGRGGEGRGREGEGRGLCDFGPPTSNSWLRHSFVILNLINISSIINILLRLSS